MEKILKKIDKGVIALVFAVSLNVLSGCYDKGNYEDYHLTLSMGIEFVDKEGNILNEELYEKGVVLDVLSVTDDKGVSVKFNFHEGLIMILEHPINLESESPEKWPKTDWQYTVRYKVPQLIGESIEELKLIFSFDGYDSKFTKAWYNGKEITRFVTLDSICPECMVNPHVFDLEDIQNRELVERRIKELLYNGEANAFIEGYNIELKLPVENVK